MKKSKTVQLGLVAAIALAACDDSQHCVTDDEGEQHCTEVKHCVTEDGTVVEDGRCDRPGGSPDAMEGAGRPFRWYYGGTGGRIYSPGARITVISSGGGSFTPGGGHSYSSPSTISRGGFGGIGAGAGA